MAQINTYDLHLKTRHSADFVRFRPENSSHRDRVSSGGIAQGLHRIVLHPGGPSRVRAAFGFAIAQHNDVRTRFRPDASARSDGLWTKSPIRWDAANGRSGILR